MTWLVCQVCAARCLLNSPAVRRVGGPGCLCHSARRKAFWGFPLPPRKSQGALKRVHQFFGPAVDCELKTRLSSVNAWLPLQTKLGPTPCWAPPWWGVGQKQIMSPEASNLDTATCWGARSTSGRTKGFPPDLLQKQNKKAIKNVPHKNTRCEFQPTVRTLASFCASEGFSQARPGAMYSHGK